MKRLNLKLCIFHFLYGCWELGMYALHIVIILALFGQWLESGEGRELVSFLSL